jgi:hypothetical protein
MIGARMLAYVTGMVNPELMLRNEYLAAENRILRGQIKGRLLLCGALSRGAQPPGQRESDFVSSEEGRSKR